MKWRAVKMQTSLRRTTAARLCWTKLAFHDCRRAFIVSEPKKTVLRSKHLDWIVASIFRFFEFSVLQFFAFTVFQLISSAVFQLSVLEFSSFRFYEFRFFEFDARGAVPIYFNGADSFSRLKNRKRETKNRKSVPWSLYLSACNTIVQ